MICQVLLALWCCYGRGDEKMTAENEFDFKFLKKRKFFIDKKRLFMARANAGLTNKELCKKAGFSHAVTDKIAAGKSVHALTVGRLAEALNVSVAYLLGEDEK